MPEPTVDDVTGRIADSRVIAIVRCPGLTIEVALSIVDTLARAGLRAVEFTLNSREPFAAIAAAVERYGDEVSIGAGTVLTVDDVFRVAEAGGTFVVSPDTNADVLGAAGEAGLVAVPGAYTGTEVRTAVRHGAAMVKLFPAFPAGSSYLAALRGPFPDVAFVPTGGVTIDDIPDLLGAGATAVGLGSVLVPSEDPLRGLVERAAAVRAVLDGGPTPPPARRTPPRTWPHGGSAPDTSRS